MTKILSVIRLYCCLTIFKGRRIGPSISVCVLIFLLVSMSKLVIIFSWLLLESLFSLTVRWGNSGRFYTETLSRVQTSNCSLTSFICSSVWEKLSISSLNSHTDEQIKLVKEKLVKEKLLVCTRLHFF